MPAPHQRHRLSPDDLARLLASQLAASRPPRSLRFSLRHSVLVGRLISCVVIVVMATAVAGAVMLGLTWWAATPTVEPEVMAGNEIEHSGASADRLSRISLLVSDAVVSWSEPVPPDPRVLGSGATFLPQMPTPTSVPAMSGIDTTTITGAASVGSPINVPTTTTSPIPATTMPPTTSTTLGATTTTAGPPATTVKATTTTSGETGTTCAGNKGDGNGSGPCGP